MIKKRCPKCSHTSYSACKEDWICPYCNEDISNQPGYSINDDKCVTMDGDGNCNDKDARREKLRLVSGQSLR